MRRVARPLLTAASIGAVLLSAACGSTTAGTATQAGTAAPAATTSAAATDPVAWMDEVCTSLTGFVDTAKKQPQFDGSNAQNVINSLTSYLGTVIAAVDTTSAGLKAAGPSPVAKGDEAVEKLDTALGTIKKNLEDSKTQLEQADPTDPTALKNAVAPLSSLENFPDPLADFTSSPELDAAAEKAPSCKSLSG